MKRRHERRSASGKLRQQLVLAGTELDDGSGRRRCCELFGSARRSWPDGKLQGAVRIDVDHALTPSPIDEHQLPDREGIQELVGDDDRRPLRHLVDRLVPFDGHWPTHTPLALSLSKDSRRRIAVVRPALHGVGAKRLLLHRAQRRAGLDQVHGGRGQERRHRPRRAQGIAHQGAAARPELDEAQRRGAAHALPDDSTPHSDQLAEHLADLGRRDEIPARADALRAAPVAVLGMGQAGAHVGIDRQRALPLDARAQDRQQRARLAVLLSAGHRPAPSCAFRPRGSRECRPEPWAANRGCRP